jgi:glyoxylase-like metal-dependent hydrolase (beta-lactamase superfamily II)/rhodanese-related sulfurtransferase
MAKERGEKIKYIFQTHFHADFVSGHMDLARKTGAQIIYGPTQMNTGYEILSAADGQEFAIGKTRVKLIHTPGHTLESSCYLLHDENGKATALFSGDTLFIGDVGRPDLAQHVIADLTEEKLAGLLYDSLHNKIMPLADDIIVYPGHGAGSACGKKMSSETQDTLGNQKRNNYALQPGLSKEAFIKELLHGLTTPPGYFPENVMMNIKGYDLFDEVLKKGLQAYSPDEFEVILAETGALLIDTRAAGTFAKGFVPGSVNIGIDGSFAVWVGTLVKDIRQKIVIITEQGREEEVVTRLARVGYDQCIGYLKGGFEAWKQAGKNTDTIESISADTFAQLYEQNLNIPVLDVRKKSEFDSEHIEGALNTPLDYIEQALPLIDTNSTMYVHCAAGYRSMAFVSILRAKGFNNLVDVAGGFKAIKATGKFKTSEFVVPTTDL